MQSVGGMTADLVLYGVHRCQERDMAAVAGSGHGVQFAVCGELLAQALGYGAEPAARVF